MLTCDFSLFSETELPSVPIGPLRFTNITENSVDCEWQPSESDGGTPILHYVIEIRESRRQNYNRAGTSPASITKFTAKRLVVDNEYFFRVRAVNQEGESRPLDGAEPITPRAVQGNN